MQSLQAVRHLEYHAAIKQSRGNGPIDIGPFPSQPAFHSGPPQSSLEARCAQPS